MKRKDILLKKMTANDGTILLLISSTAHTTKKNYFARVEPSQVSDNTPIASKLILSYPTASPSMNLSISFITIRSSKYQLYFNTIAVTPKP